MCRLSLRILVMAKRETEGGVMVETMTLRSLKPRRSSSEAANVGRR